MSKKNTDIPPRPDMDPMLGDKTIELDGVSYPVIDVEISSASHPFYTGTQKSVDNMGGRVEKFRNRFGKTTTIAK